ncbi:hypothetical protein PIB30_092251 [Stylosanthes scabra]|uniref:Retrotransposon gag domain-containing protein n=1 Tax=Stylosanthes scabra TaxID=79078 RepID=A0ABU6YXM7_9FABA|nr:hypothetical protein [Stylosanthes scabra]
MADQQTPTAEELFALVTTLQAKLQQLRDSQNGNGGSHENGNGGGGGDEGRGGGGDDSDTNDGDRTDDSDNIGSHDTYVSNTASARPGRGRKCNNLLSKEIMAFQMPMNFTLSTTLKAYDGISDPIVLVSKFKNMMLLNGSIFSFQELSDLFINHFAASAIYQNDSDYLSTIKQGQHERLLEYMTRFTKVVIEFLISTQMFIFMPLRVDSNLENSRKPLLLANRRFLPNSDKRPKDKWKSKSLVKLGERTNPTSIKRMTSLTN